MLLSCSQPTSGSLRFSPDSMNWSSNFPLDGCALPPSPHGFFAVPWTYGAHSHLRSSGLLFLLPGTPHFAWLVPSLNSGLYSNVTSIERPHLATLSKLPLSPQSISLRCFNFLYSMNQHITYTFFLSFCLFHPCMLPEGRGLCPSYFLLYGWAYQLDPANSRPLRDTCMQVLVQASWRPQSPHSPPQFTIQVSKGAHYKSRFAQDTLTADNSSMAPH